MADTNALDDLIREVCVDLGWCGSVVDGEHRHVTDFLPASGDLTSNQFAESLFRADGADLGDRIKLQGDAAKIRDAFIRHMGGDAVDVGQFFNA